MILRKFLCFSLIFVSSMSSSSDNMKSANLSLKFNDKCLIMSAPYKEDANFFNTPSSIDFDLNNDANFDELHSSDIVMKKFWGFWKSFVPAPIGVLKMRIRVLRTHLSEMELSSGNLIEEIKNRSTWVTQKVNRELREANKKEIDESIPIDFKVTRINDVDWVEYKFDFNSKSKVFVAWLDKKRYVEVVFDYVDNSRGYANNFKETSMKNTYDVMNSAKFVKCKAGVTH